jgi:hypothetical protein
MKRYQSQSQKIIFLNVCNWNSIVNTYVVSSFAVGTLHNEVQTHWWSSGAEVYRWRCGKKFVAPYLFEYLS